MLWLNAPSLYCAVTTTGLFGRGLPDAIGTPRDSFTPVNCVNVYTIHVYISSEVYASLASNGEDSGRQVAYRRYGRGVGCQMPAAPFHQRPGGSELGERRVRIGFGWTQPGPAGRAKDGDLRIAACAGGSHDRGQTCIFMYMVAGRLLASRRRCERLQVRARPSAAGLPKCAQAETTEAIPKGIKGNGNIDARSLA